MHRRCRTSKQNRTSGGTDRSGRPTDIGRSDAGERYSRMSVLLRMSGRRMSVFPRRSDTSSTEHFLRISGHLQTFDHRLTGTFRTTDGCVLIRGLWSSSDKMTDVCRTSGRICATGRPVLSGRPTSIVHLSGSNGYFYTSTIYSLPPPTG